MKMADPILEMLCRKYNSLFKCNNPEEEQVVNLYKQGRVEESKKIFSDYERQRAAMVFKDFPDLSSRVAHHKVLDLGCGASGISLALSELAPEMVCGVDIDKEAIQFAQKQAQQDSLKANMKFLTYDGKHLPFEDQFFDVILLQDVIEHVENPLAVLSECKRVLNQNGRIYLTTFSWYHPHGMHLWSAFPGPWNHLIFPERIVTKIHSGSSIKYEQMGFNKMTLSRLNQLIREAGLAIEFKKFKSKKWLGFLRQIPWINEFIISLLLYELKPSNIE